MMTLKRAVFLDRDGVLNEAIIKNGKPYPPQNLSELKIITDVPKALSELRKHDFLLIVITNQPDVARSVTKKEDVDKINFVLQQELLLDAVFTCYHDDKDNCPCRKPLPGLLLQAAKKYNIDLAKSFMIGDRWKDIEAGRNSGCKTIWLKSNYNEPTPEKNADFVAHSMYEASEWIIKNEF